MKQSAGILLYKIDKKKLAVFLVHPGGPFFKNKDNGAWSIPKGEIGENEDPKLTAIRELKEETGIEIEDIENLIELGEIKQKGGKKVFAWAYEIINEPQLKPSNTFELEWPPRSGNIQKFSEVDKGEFFDIHTAALKINQAQKEFVNILLKEIGLPDSKEPEQLKII